MYYDTYGKFLFQLSLVSYNLFLLSVCPLPCPCVEFPHCGLVLDLLALKVHRLFVSWSQCLQSDMAVMICNKNVLSDRLFRKAFYYYYL